MSQRVHMVCAVSISTWVLVAMPESSAIEVNNPLPITHRVTVQPIILSNTDDSNTAEMFGNATQQAAIESLIDSIWAQAGIDVEWIVPNYWHNTSANMGELASLNILLSHGASAGVTNADPLVLNTYFVEITPGGTDMGENYTNGIAMIGANGISQAVGDNLVTWGAGQEVVASIVAHEIGHNLGLNHVSESQNLMESYNSGERLNSSQIDVTLNSIFSVPSSLDPADFNDDGYVNHEDLLAWKNGFGIDTGATHAQGDADEDYDVDGSDLMAWQRSYDGTQAVTAVSSAVPEPGTLVLGGMLLLLARCRRRK